MAGQLSCYRNRVLRRVVQVLIVFKVCFLVALEVQEPLFQMNPAVMFCIGWHVYCLLGSEVLVRAIQSHSLVGLPCRRLLLLSALNWLLFLGYLLGFWANKAEHVRSRTNADLPVGIVIQTYPFPPATPWALLWGVTLTFVRIPMTLVWSMGLHLLALKVCDALSIPDKHQYRPPPPQQPPPSASASQHNDTRGSSLASLEEGGRGSDSSPRAAVSDDDLPPPTPPPPSATKVVPASVEEEAGGVAAALFARPPPSRRSMPPRLMTSASMRAMSASNAVNHRSGGASMDRLAMTFQLPPQGQELRHR